METLKKLLEDFYQLLGINISIVDQSFYNVLVCSRAGNESFCEFIQSSPKCLSICVKSDKQAMKAAQKSGKTLCYTCPFGIQEAMIPIHSPRGIAGYFFIDTGVADEKAAREAVDRVLGVDAAFSRAQLQAHAALLPRNSEKETETYVKMLEILAEHIVSHNLLTAVPLSMGQRIKEEIHRSLDRPISLALLSKSLHVSTVTITEAFRREFHTTVMHYVKEKRMELAKALLKEQDLTVSEVAARCGFSDPEYFSRCFKQETGLPPALWRKSQATGKPDP